MTRRPEKRHLEWKMVRGKLVPRFRKAWTEGGKRRERVITLDWRGDPARLDMLYWQAMRGDHPAQKEPAPAQSWRALIIAWRSDQRIQRELSDGTKRSYRTTMDAILEKNADLAVADMTRQELRAVHNKYAATPRKADHFVQVVSLLWNYALAELDWEIGPNPAAKFRLYGKTREFEPWPDWMVKAAAQAPVDVRITVELMLGTGQRPAAAINMRRDDFAGEAMWVTDEKGDQRFQVYCPARLRAFVDSLPVRGRHLLAKNLTEAKGYDAVEKQFRAWREQLGDKARPYTLHGLRKLAITQLALAGCSDAEIQSVTGQSPQMVAFYRQKASKLALSKVAQNRRDQNGNGT